jgi:polyhydroxybutyrate depolymerase
MRAVGLRLGIVAVAAAAVTQVPWCGRRSLQVIRRGNETSRESALPRVRERPYSFRAPAKLDPARSYPLVVALHGLGSRGEDFARYFAIDQLVDEQGFLAAFPDGTVGGSPPWRRRFWNATDICCDFAGTGVDDVAYLDDVIADMSARFRVDPKRIFLVGHSNGGYMSYRFACDRASRVAAIVSSAGAMWTDRARCRPSEPVAVLEIHSTDDDIVPYEGGPLRASTATLKSARATVEDWVAFDGCGGAPDTSAPPRDLIDGEWPPPGPGGTAETTIDRWTGCRGVELWTVHGGVHSPRFRQPALARALGSWLLSHPRP